MARCTVRVELHIANSDDYDLLHEFMGEEGCSRYITNSDDGVKYQMPTAEYNISGDRDPSAVLKKAKQAASRTAKKYMVLVTESDGRTWYNLLTWEGSSLRRTPRVGH
jgi:hypothetical protein